VGTGIRCDIEPCGIAPLTKSFTAHHRPALKKGESKKVETD
jgi:hypothetical protein